MQMGAVIKAAVIGMGGNIGHATGQLHRGDVVQAKFLKAGESISAVVRSASTQYQWVLVVVCLPEFRACEISPVSTVAPGTSRLMRVLLPEPEGPSTSVTFAAQVLQKHFPIHLVRLRQAQGSTP